MNNSMVETTVGAAVIALATGFFIFLYSVGGLGGHSGGYIINASFGSVDGISVGTDVRVAGIKVGSVTSQRLNLESYRASVELDVDSTIKLPEDSTAKIASEGLLGGKFISLEPGGSETMLDPGGEIVFTQDAIDIFGLVSQFVLGNSGSKKESDSEQSTDTEQQAQ
jgi:phospholipid/cholesterol/gamma-HCH transport system substrate-binding protein